MGCKPNICAVEIEAAERFNRLASENRWAVLCDPYCHFTDPKLCEMVSVWQSKANGGIPYRRDMTVRILQPFISQLSIYELVSSEDGSIRWRVRLMGTEVALTTAEMTGKFLDEVVPQDFLDRWNAVGEAILDAGCPLRVLRRADSFGKRHIVSEEFVAPLANDSGRPEMTMSISSFENFDSWEIVEGRLRGELELD